MGKVISQKVWVRFTGDELQRLLQVADDYYPRGTMIDVHTKRQDDSIAEVTFGIRLFKPGPLRCPECGSPDPDEVHSGDCSLGGPVDDEFSEG